VRLYYEGDTLLPEAHWSNITLLIVVLLTCIILVEFYFVLKSTQVLSYRSHALSITGEGNMLLMFPATTMVLFVKS